MTIARNKSNITIKSNLILDDQIYKPVFRFIPGDYIGEIYPEKVDSRNIEGELTKQQLIEHKQYLHCLLCGSPCAGMCKKMSFKCLCE